MSLKKLLLVLGMVVILASPAQAENTSVRFNISAGQDDIMAYSLSVSQLYEPLVAGSSAELAPTAEVAAHLISRKDDLAVGLSVSPGLRLSVFTDTSFSPYVGLSVGGALLSESEYGPRDLGSNLLIRTKGVAGVQFGEGKRHSIQGEYSYYSTWGICHPDDGLNTYGGSYSYSF